LVKNYLLARKIPYIMSQFYPPALVYCRFPGGKTMSHTPIKKQTLNRRQALKTLAAVTGAVSLAALPNNWQAPAVEVGALPAHAQNSATAAIRATNIGGFSLDVTLTWPGSGGSDTQAIDAGQSYTWTGLTPIDVAVTGATVGSPCYQVSWICPDSVNLQDFGTICTLPAGTTKTIDVSCGGVG
jgi:hypothetical protein